MDPNKQNLPHSNETNNPLYSQQNDFSGISQRSGAQGDQAEYVNYLPNLFQRQAGFYHHTFLNEVSNANTFEHPAISFNQENEVNFSLQTTHLGAYPDQLQVRKENQNSFALVDNKMMKRSTNDAHSIVVNNMLQEIKYGRVNVPRDRLGFGLSEINNFEINNVQQDISSATESILRDAKRKLALANCPAEFNDSAVNSIPLEMENYKAEFPERHSTTRDPGREIDIEQSRYHAADPTIKNKCHICSKQFKRLSSLKTHYNSHTGYKSHRCPWQGCGKSFNVKSNMTRHFKLHARRFQ